VHEAAICGGRSAQCKSDGLAHGFRSSTSPYRPAGTALPVESAAFKQGPLAREALTDHVEDGAHARDAPQIGIAGLELQAG
jgi:hypothetical protein